MPIGAGLVARCFRVLDHKRLSHLEMLHVQSHPILLRSRLGSGNEIGCPCYIYLRAATAAYYHIRQQDKYKDVFLIGGVLIGSAAGWLSDADVHGILLNFLPWRILGSLVLSSSTHKRVGQRWQREKGEEALLPNVMEI